MLTKHDERKMPKNRGHIASLARSYTRTAIKTLAGIMMEPNSPPMARIAAAKVLLDRGWGKCSETHNINLDGETSFRHMAHFRRGDRFLGNAHTPGPPRLRLRQARFHSEERPMEGEETL